MLMSLLSICKGKGYPVIPTSCRGMKLLEHAFKLYEKVLDGQFCKFGGYRQDVIQIYAWKGTIGTVFILKGLTEKSRPKNSKLFLLFFDLEKAFDRVLREVISLARH